jgi:hypothetical protein
MAGLDFAPEQQGRVESGIAGFVVDRHHRPITGLSAHLGDSASHQADPTTITF